MAKAQRLAARPARNRHQLLDRLDQTGRIVADAHDRLAAAAERDQNVGPAGEWLLDNIHVVQEHILEVRESLPRGYYRELPELAIGALAGYPRVYEIAIALISHTEARVELDDLTLFVAAFQEVASLRIGELWALPAMLRLGLIESVRRMALRSVRRLEELETADAWATRLTEASRDGDGRLHQALADFLERPPELSPTFVSRFLQQLRFQHGSAPLLRPLELWVTEQGMSAEDASGRATERVALTQVMMANSITSLRAIARMDWETFVESQSTLDAELRRDPAGVYPRMTFETRDHYRHVVERIAKRTEREEAAVAREAVARSAAATEDRHRHVGYFLVDQGLRTLEAATGYRPPAGARLHRWATRHPYVVFVGGVLLGTACALAALLWLAGPSALAAWPLVVLLGLLPANDIAVTSVNQLVTAFLPPRVLPKLDLSEGVPEELRTVVVVPTLFGSAEGVEEALEHLEVQYLANPEEHLHFAILSDFVDAATETLPEDAEILAAAVAGVETLNQRHGEGDIGPFALFHRPRRWNSGEGVWMGWERKRGKLAEFNGFLAHGGRAGFSTVTGCIEALRGSRYVITLDSDTVLPPEAARALIGALAHPLNQAAFDPSRGRVTSGYGILQPRVGVSLPSAHRSRFAAVHSGHPGVDPYTTAVSDVYQDLFGEGSFTGKGIYDVAAFRLATRGRFPENTLLSHDLIEGNYARAGLVTDVVVYDDYPARYLSFTLRKHRWIRGDWQLLPWLRGTVPGPDGPERNRLSLLSRWKILDNLRRSLVEPAWLLFFLAGWLVLPGDPLRWTLLALGAMAAPHVVALLLVGLRPPQGKSLRAWYAPIGGDAGISLQQLALSIAFLPHQAGISVDAIVRTLWRMLVTHRHMLEWRTASQAERMVTEGAVATWRTMWPAVALGVGPLVVAGGAMALGGAAGLGPLVGAAFPVAALWVASPWIARAISAPAAPLERRLPRGSRRQAMRYALLHWRFFEKFVGPETWWLAPDNYQADPVPVVAMRTSPTNVSLQLLATVSAFDLGFITLGETVERLERTFDTLGRLRRYRGHFYNWYDLTTLEVLEPAYVSTVDSGNLAGHLVALRQALLALPEQPVYDARVIRALTAGLSLAADQAGEDEAVTARIHAARAELAGADSMNPAVTLAGVAGALEGSGSEWLDWCRGLAERRGATVEGIELWSVERRDRESGVVSERWDAVAARRPEVAALLARLRVLAERCAAIVGEMDFGFLYDRSRSLFAIGYRAGSPTLDPSYYDLLASEARLASFMAVARDEVPVEHWFRLGRTLTRAAGEMALVSWSGSMFEYLMPGLVMRSFRGTVLDDTCRGAVRRQVAYAARYGVPWGISESAYNLRDRHHTYQYRAFGVPDLALKRGLGRDLVVAPYASALAALVAPRSAIANLGVLEKLGALGPYGFRESLDYTRPAPGQPFALVETWMAHHVGMSLVALTNALTGQVWQQRFHADPLVRAAELLLYERVPRRLDLQEPQTARAGEALPDPELSRPAVREVDTADTVSPHVALLGHWPYTTMVSHCGAGYSRFDQLAVTRWRADGTRDAGGQFCYLRDVDDGRVWSAGHQPVCADADVYRAYLATDRVAIHRADGEIETRTQIVAVPADGAEVRQVTVTNTGDRVREVELTSYGEIVLAPPDADRSHPAFGNLFVQTEWHDWCTAISATRRPRSANEPTLWGIHVVDTGPHIVGPVTCETDRARFLGRGRSTRDPAALDFDGPLSGATGAVLDPVFAIRVRVRLEPRHSAAVAFTTLVAPTRERAFELADRYHHPHAAQRALDLAWTSAQVDLRELGISAEDAGVFQEIAGHLFYPNPALRASSEEQIRGQGSQPLLWSIGVSGDWPILLASIDSEDGLPTLRQLLQAHHYWRRRGMTVDLVILNTRTASYYQDLELRITAAVHGSPTADVIDRPGGVFHRRRDLLSDEVLGMLRATARVQVGCDGRSLARLMEAAVPAGESVELDPEPVRARTSGAVEPGTLTQIRVRALRAAKTLLGTAAAVVLREKEGEPSPPPPREPTPGADDAVSAATGGPDNGHGGPTETGEYEIHIVDGHLPPAPWANVIANRAGGFLVTERGAGCTWAASSYFYRLTPWHNDPVTDPAGEALYLRDEETGVVWSPTPAPMPAEGRYTVRHGQGASTFEHERGGIATSLVLGLAEDAAVKLSLLRVTNTGARPRRVALTVYVEWTLGALREHSQHQVHTRFEPEHGAILAQNRFDAHFAEQVAFCATSAQLTTFTADRREFLGRNGSPEAPLGLEGTLTGATGAGLDPCAALRTVLELAPGESREVAVLLGAALGREAAMELMGRLQSPGAAREAIEANCRRWRERLSVVSVRTPEPTFDLLVNRWTLYQAISCRMWGRTALYQSSGAYGFRDQLQDSMALVYAEPGLAREQIVRAAGRQFHEGDVQHWWHPHSGRGVRTKFSDDLVWLPYVADHYVRVTGDAAVLDEAAPYLRMRELLPEEHEVYDLPETSTELGTVYQHCLRALRRACTEGPHGLPLIGAGDWNDGMNRVGVEGKGESVWLAWFLIAALRGFATRCDARGDAKAAAELRGRADGYLAAVEAHGWDGEWYRRAYYDDGTPLGSAASVECRIDSIAQSWSVISGAGAVERQRLAMRSLDRHLVREDVGILLLTPPFDRTSHDPGYIKGYLPGVRENGAQYTHAALWAVLATAMGGDGERAFGLFQLLNPLERTRTAAGVATYRTEPYVVAADVYSAEGHVGRGGWTWYTGSASWMYRVGLEAILGFTKEGDRFRIDPRVPAAWPRFVLEYRHGNAWYEVVVERPTAARTGSQEVELDGRLLEGEWIGLVDDGGRHSVTIRPRSGSRPASGGSGSRTPPPTP